ncbi:DUF2626 domain-containing protein [Salicibibacter cibarius]|uniref:DUF2626 domain-containing protein n=1 Tax=Salicibibacter cibarius TaxID=2743000 RepID=A0A7T6Z2T8_9BACI|nr:DUF2626 domain-containing protein [Salicibibacter cibarius]QQK75895.1 DUF2626 domain-containing protein [Salicibibacter cibarius]
MSRMYRVMAFWTGVFAVLFFVGEMYEVSLLFFANTAAFVGLGFMGLSERTYLYIFGAYLTLFMVGFSYYTIFLMEPALGH